MDQRKFAAIERLIQKEVEKMKVPEDLGEVPKYEPMERKGRNTGTKRNFRRRG
jgi:hypothetical protein